MCALVRCSCRWCTYFESLSSGMKAGMHGAAHAGDSATLTSNVWLPAPPYCIVISQP